MHRQKCIEDLKAKESNNPKAFWNIINRTTKHPKTGNVTIDEFFEHFSVLNATEYEESGLESILSESQTPSNVCNEYSESETLNSPITEDEVSKAVKRLKNGKACGEDCILNEMIKSFYEHLHMLTQTFNVVLLSGHIPNEWATGLIKPIYKN